MDVVGNFNDTISLVYDSAVEVAVTDDRIDQISCSSRSQAYPHSIEIIEVFLQTLLAEMAADV